MLPAAWDVGEQPLQSSLATSLGKALQLSVCCRFITKDDVEESIKTGVMNPRKSDFRWICIATCLQSMLLQILCLMFAGCISIVFLAGCSRQPCPKYVVDAEIGPDEKNIEVSHNGLVHYTLRFIACTSCVSGPDIAFLLLLLTLA